MKILTIGDIHYKSNLIKLKTMMEIEIINVIEHVKAKPIFVDIECVLKTVFSV